MTGDNENLPCSRFTANRFVAVLTSLCDWSEDYDCNMEIHTSKDLKIISVIFDKEGYRILKSFSYEDLKNIDEMCIVSALQDAYNKLQIAILNKSSNKLLQ